MKKIKSLTALLIAVAMSFTLSVKAESARTRFFVITGPTSPSNNSSIQNVMSFVDRGEVVGLIPTDITTDPAALNMPPLLRGSELNFGPTGMWDSRAATGVFAQQSGQRIGWTLDYSNSVPFLASSINFRVWSSDPANTLRFSGNIASNGTTALTFSPTLRGEYYGPNGKETYYNGEVIATHPVNRVIPFIRLGYQVTDTNQAQLNLNYFRNQMQMTNYVAFYTSTWGVTNWVSSLGHLTAHAANGNGNKIVVLRGQRQIGLTYTLKRTLSLNPGEVSWQTVATGLVDGGSYTNTLPIAFYRSYEEGITSAARAASAASPVLKVWNGPE